MDQGHRLMRTMTPHRGPARWCWIIPAGIIGVVLMWSLIAGWMQ